jgi:hypothetical protein
MEKRADGQVSVNASRPSVYMQNARCVPSAEKNTHVTQSSKLMQKGTVGAGIGLRLVCAREP